MTENIGIEKTKIQSERGFVKVDEYMRTAEPGIYAIGDIALGYPLLAHSGAMEGIVAVTHIAGKPAKPINLLRIPNATYCHPEIGSVGLTEAKAKEKGYTVKVGKFPFTANSRASIVGQHEGFIKIVTDAKYGEILGVHIIGPNATELIAESVLALEMECTAEELAQHYPCASHIVRGDAGCGECRVWHGDQCVRSYQPSAVSFQPKPLLFRER